MIRRKIMLAVFKVLKVRKLFHRKPVDGWMTESLRRRIAEAGLHFLGRDVSFDQEHRQEPPEWPEVPPHRPEPPRPEPRYGPISLHASGVRAVDFRPPTRPVYEIGRERPVGEVPIPQRTAMPQVRQGFTAAQMVAMMQGDHGYVNNVARMQEAFARLLQNDMHHHFWGMDGASNRGMVLPQDWVVSPVIEMNGVCYVMSMDDNGNIINDAELDEELVALIDSELE